MVNGNNNNTAFRPPPYDGTTVRPTDRRRRRRRRRLWTPAVRATITAAADSQPYRASGYRSEVYLRGYSVVCAWTRHTCSCPRTVQTARLAAARRRRSDRDAQRRLLITVFGIFFPVISCADRKTASSSGARVW